MNTLSPRQRRKNRVSRHVLHRRAFIMPERTDFGVDDFWTVRGLAQRFRTQEDAMHAAITCGHRCHELTYHVAATFTLDISG